MIDMENNAQNPENPQHDAKLPVGGCRQGDLCIICGDEIDADYGNVCSECDDSHLDD